MTYEIRLPDGYVVSDERTRLDVSLVHRFLSVRSYWASGADPAQVERGIADALPLGAYAATGEQVGFAMAIGDRKFSAQLCNVFVLPEWRGRQLGTALVRGLLDHPALASVAHWLLSTDDAAEFYMRLGFRRTGPGAATMVLRRIPQTPEAPR